MSTTTLPRRFGRYTLVRRLATGGMAEVYLATARGAGGFEKRVAIKRVHPHLASGFGSESGLTEEAKLAVHLTHPNIIQVFDLGRAEGTEFIVMEHVEGYDAQHVLDSLRTIGRPFPIDLAAFVMSAVCRALDYAHRRRDSHGRPVGVVHRDVSPQNILLSLAGEVKLADFGIAKTNARRSEPDARVIKGKYFYMSPEQARAEPLDHRSDVFSSGIVLWELLVGRRLHEASDLRSLLDAVRTADVPPPSSIRLDVPPTLDSVVARATARDPDRRFENAGAMADALEDYLAARPPIDAQSAIAGLLRGVSGSRDSIVRAPRSRVPKTRDGVGTVPTEPAQPTESFPRHALDDGESTLAGWRSPDAAYGRHRWGWALILGALFVGFSAWLLYGA